MTCYRDFGVPQVSLTFASDYRIVPFYLNLFLYMDAIRFEFRSFARDLGREGDTNMAFYMKKAHLFCILLAYSYL